MISKRCVILGGGGHAKVLLDCLRYDDSVQVMAVLDPDAARRGQRLYGIPIPGGDDYLPALLDQGVTHFLVGVGSIGKTTLRQKLFAYALEHQVIPFTVQHPSVIVSPHATIGAGAQLLPGAIINADTVLGQNVVVNTGAIVEHDCVIGDHVFIATGARITGGVQIGAGCHIGAAASIRQGIKIGANAIIGMGAVVVKDVPPDTTVVGVPAAPLSANR